MGWLISYPKSEWIVVTALWVFCNFCISFVLASWVIVSHVFIEDQYLSLIINLLCSINILVNSSKRKKFEYQAMHLNSIVRVVVKYVNI